MNPTNSTTAPPRWRRDRWDEPGTIYFWSGRGGQFESFSNFAITPFALASWQRPSETVTFPSGEHAFQAAKPGRSPSTSASGWPRAHRLPSGWDAGLPCQPAGTSGAAS